MRKPQNFLACGGQLTKTTQNIIYIVISLKSRRRRENFGGHTPLDFGRRPIPPLAHTPPRFGPKGRTPPTVPPLVKTKNKTLGSGRCG